MKWLKQAFNRYFEFNGRSCRREYWAFAIFWMVAVTVAGWVDQAAGLQLGKITASDRPPGLLVTIFTLLTFAPGLAVAVRRLHDSNRTGWWVALPVLPLPIMVFLAIDGLIEMFFPFGIIALIFIPPVVLIVLLCLPGTKGPNRFGNDTKAANVAAVFD